MTMMILITAAGAMETTGQAENLEGSCVFVVVLFELELCTEALDRCAMELMQNVDYFWTEVFVVVACLEAAARLRRGWGGRQPGNVTMVDRDELIRGVTSGGCEYPEPQMRYALAEGTLPEAVELPVLLRHLAVGYVTALGRGRFVFTADVNDMWTWGGIRRAVGLMEGRRAVYLHDGNMTGVVGALGGGVALPMELVAAYRTEVQRATNLLFGGVQWTDGGRQDVKWRRFEGEVKSRMAAVGVVIGSRSMRLLSDQVVVGLALVRLHTVKIEVVRTDGGWGEAQTTLLVLQDTRLDGGTGIEMNNDDGSQGAEVDQGAAGGEAWTLWDHSDEEDRADMSEDAGVATAVDRDNDH